MRSPRVTARASGRVERLRAAALLALLGVAVACGRPVDAPPAPSTLVVGIDVSGSFRNSGQFEDAIDYAALYIYGRMHGLGDLRPATAIFVGSLGGERAGEAKTFHPIQDLSGKSVAEIAMDLRTWFAESDPSTDFNAFFQRVAVHVKRNNLVLAPLSVVLFSDGVPDFPGQRLTDEELYRKVDMAPLDYLSRSVTVRLLYATPKVAQSWEELVPRQRVRLWTQDFEVMRGWRRHAVEGAAPEAQDGLWDWTEEIVDFRVRRTRVI
jgi:hypothetical protein